MHWQSYWVIIQQDTLAEAVKKRSTTFIVVEPLVGKNKANKRIS